MLTPTGTYPGGSSVDADYPGGAPDNVTAPSAGDGFPLDFGWLRDLEAFKQKAMLDAGLVASETADKAVIAVDADNQLWQALKSLLVPFDNQYATNHIDGLRMEWDSTTNITIKRGAAANVSSNGNIDIPSDFAKNLTLEWVAGAGNGAKPVGVTITADTWYTVFGVTRSDDGPGGDAGTSDITLGTSSETIVPTLFYADPDSATEGFNTTGNSRRIGWVRFDGSGFVTQFVTTAEDPRRVQWYEQHADASSAVDATVTRVALTADHVPPEALGAFVISVADFTSSNAIAYITELGQNDVGTGVAATVITGGTGEQTTVKSEWYVDSNQQIFYRADTADLNIALLTDGYRDLAIQE